MLRGIVALAAALRLRTVAEGVETWEEAFFLRAAVSIAVKVGFGAKPCPRRSFPRFKRGLSAKPSKARFNGRSETLAMTERDMTRGVLAVSLSSL